MSNKIIIIYILFFFSIIGNLKSQCNTAAFTATPTNATCLSNGSIAVQVPGATTCSGWNAILTKPDLSEVSIIIPANGGPVVFNSLSAGNYNVRLFNGITTIQYPSNPVTITTSYVNMNITSSATNPTCPNGSSGYVANGQLTITINNGGVGPFMYEITSLAGTQSFGPTTDTNHTFNGLEGGETVVFTVVDSVGGQPGCATSVTQTPIIPQNPNVILTNIPVSYRKINCSIGACNNMEAHFTYGNTDNGRMARIVATTDGAKISINGGSDTTFTVDGNKLISPVMQSGDTWVATFTDDCDTITQSGTVATPTNINVINVAQEETIYLSCVPMYKIDMGSNKVNWCDTTLVLKIYKEDSLIPGTYYLIDSIAYPDNWRFLRDAGNKYIDTLADTGNYRVVVDDGCFSAQKDFTIVPEPNPLFTELELREFNTLLDSSTGLILNQKGRLPSGDLSYTLGFKYPLTYRIMPTSGATSVTFTANHPYNLAGTYTVNFPIYQTIPTRGHKDKAIADLPSGISYTVRVWDACGDSVDLVHVASNYAQYNPDITVNLGCSNSNSISYNLNSYGERAHPNLAPEYPVGFLGTWPDANLTLHNDDGFGAPGTVVSGYSETNSPYYKKRTLTGLPSGDYVIRITQLGRNNYSSSKNINSAAFGSQTNSLSYYFPVTIPPYQDITASTSVFNCSDTSGIVRTTINSGTPIYPVLYQLFDPNDLINPLQSDTAFSSTDSNALINYFNSTDTGNYIVKVISGYTDSTVNGCFSLSLNTALYNTGDIANIIASDTTVCITNNNIVLGIPLQLADWNLWWLDKNNTVIDSNINPLNITPTHDSLFISKYQLKSNIGCLNPPILYDTMAIYVIPKADTTKSILGDTICFGNNAIVTVLSGDSGVIYEVYKNGDTLTPRLITPLTTTSGDYTITIPSNHINIGTDTFQIAVSNSFCSEVIMDSMVYVYTYDTIPPLFVENDTTIIMACNGALPPLLDSAVIDSIGLVSITVSVSIIDSTCSNNFKRVATYIARDTCGYSDTLIQTIIIKDSINPTITCQDTTIYLDVFGLASIDTSYVVSNFGDNCEVDSVWINPSSSTFSCSDVGVVPVRVFITDVCGNIDSCTSNITVLDTLNPTITCIDTTIYLGPLGTFSIDTSYILVSFMDNCAVDSIWLSNDFFSCTDTGINNVTIYIRDASLNIDSCSANVNVLDTTAPAIFCMDTTIYLNASGSFTIDTSFVLQAIFDVCSLDTVWMSQYNFNCMDKGVNNVTLYAKDFNGNIDSCFASVTVIDSTAPIVTCVDTSIFLNSTGNIIIDTSFVLTSLMDNCDIDSVWLSTNSFNCLDTGNNMVTIYGRDSSGNIGSCTANVYVLDTLKPVILCNDTTIYLNNNGQYTIDTSYVHVFSSGVCGIDSVWLNKTSFTCSNVGQDSVIIYAKTNNGIIDSCQSYVYVMDTIKPSITCPMDQADTLLYPCVYSVPDYSNLLLSNDNCTPSNLIVTQYPTAGTTLDASNDTSLIVWLIVSDTNGNTDSCNIQVIVTCEKDLVIPQFISPNGDGLNDTWYIKNITNYPKAKALIYNRWGALIFQKDGYDNTWEGQINTASSTIGSKEHLPDGTYFYILELNDIEQRVFQGYIQIKR